MAGAAGDAEPAEVTEIHTAASTCAIPTIRTVAVDLATRAGFDFDSIVDLRVAVDDVCAKLVCLAAANVTLSCSFWTVWLERIEMTAEVDVKTMTDPLPRGSFGWWVLQCLADEVTALVLPSDTGRGARVCLILIKYAWSAGLW
jgi:serine/threonine-protein kinase RsbW